jgi:hypothetical protein
LEFGTIASSAASQNMSVAGNHDFQRSQVFVVDVNRPWASIFRTEPALQVPLDLRRLSLVGPTFGRRLAELRLTHRTLCKSHKSNTLQKNESWTLPHVIFRTGELTALWVYDKPFGQLDFPHGKLIADDPWAPRRLPA